MCAVGCVAAQCMLMRGCEAMSHIVSWGLVGRDMFECTVAKVRLWLRFARAQFCDVWARVRARDLHTALLDVGTVGVCVRYSYSWRVLTRS